jgi:fructokinase
LAQRSPDSRRSIERLLASASAETWLVFDINLRQNFFNRDIIEHSLNLANVLKLNDHELPVVAEMFCREDKPSRQIESLATRFGLRVVALTCGGEGSLLYREGQWSECAAPKVEVKDTVGAGDAFTAALCLGLLRGLELNAINTAANRLAAFVCSCAGATPKLPEELRWLLAPVKAQPSELPAV